MNLISAAERLSAIDRSSVTFDPGRCLHTCDQFSSCEACLGFCPSGAIQPGKPPIFDEKKCTACLACLPACPVNAFSADDAVPALLTCAARLESGSIELICKQNSQARLGLSADQTAVQLRGCLAGLGAGAYVSLAALGLSQMTVRLDTCSGCVWGCLVPMIESQLDLASRIFRERGLEIQLKTIAADCAVVERPLWDADNPPLSRRDLFRFVSRQGQVALARTMAKDGTTHGQSPTRDRQRLFTALSHFPAGGSGDDSARFDSEFVSLRVSEECSACGVCARACPSGALELEKAESKYNLKFTAWKCTGCDVCAHVCAPNALRMSRQASLDQVFAGQQETLRSGDLAQCVHCNTWFAAQSGQKYCPACEFRRKNPFGSKIPPGLDISKLSK